LPGVGGVVDHPWPASLKVERSLSWLNCYRRLQVALVPWERDSARFFAFVLLACALVCFNRALTGHSERHAVDELGGQFPRVAPISHSWPTG
jgi:hypothetical protein